MIARTEFQTPKREATVDRISEFSPFQHQRSDDASVRSSRILIIDDEPAVAMMVRKYLKDCGFEHFDLVHKAESVLDHIESTKPDIILLDIHLGSMNGLTILETIRATHHLEHIPVIVLTQSNDELTKLTALSLGASDFLAKPVTSCELVARVRNTLSSKLYRDKVLDYTLQLESDVLTDALTGIPNRRAFDYELKRRMGEWRRQKTPLALVMIDIDHFKQFNDRYGHGAGDSALQAVAKTLKENTRAMDLVARYGGEEFVLILPATGTAAAVKTCMKTREAISRTVVNVADQSLSVTASIGLAVVGNADDAELLIRRADNALYSAKQAGRDCCHHHNGGHCVPLTPKAETTEQTAGNSSVHSGTDQEILNARIMVIDDEPTTIAIARKYLKDEGYSKFFSVTDSTTAMESIIVEEPDIVLLDLRMPVVNGFDILAEMRNDERTKSISVIVLTATKDKEAKVQALNLGANDFIEKPMQGRELIARVQNILLAKGHVDMLRDYSSRLEYEVQLRTTELMASRREAVQCLARAAELRDDVTGKHVIRVGRFAAIIAEELGFSEERINWMEHAAQLHDVGKIGISDLILHKPGKLTDEELKS